MKKVVQFSIIVGALAFLVAPTSAQMTTSASTSHLKTGGGMQAMMPECRAMMNEFMADPIVQKRMMAIMQKHMKQHSGQGSMMMMPGMAGAAKGMQGGSPGSDPSEHEAHHIAQPAATPTAAGAPLATPSP